ncbi:MAG TPA: hybrid sensor histidine kinase/response regulator [Polyangiales bacterium]|nr:hybrid sensor histidine kinase/response regulator [Polyangiales bacterium]
MGQDPAWESALGNAQQRLRATPPLVLVADNALEGHGALIASLHEHAPWARIYLMGSPSSAANPIAVAVPKPFDAAELAALLVREQELAELDLARRNLQAHVEELAMQRRRLERELEHAERLAAIGRIAAGMAHEINNPLAVIHASSTYLAELAQGSKEPEFLECTKDIALAIERISSFVQHVCGFARRERPQLCDTPLAQAVDIALRMVRPRAGERGVSLRVESGLEARVPHDPPRLAQAILNLLSNAVDAAAAGGKTVVLRVREQPGLVRIEVDDDGPGVSPEIAGSLFEPFATTKPPGQGTGLGLAITQQIVLDHRGSVGLHSRPEGGTRAELVLPSFDPREQRILVLDPDPSVRRVLVQDLRRERFDVVAAESLERARELLSEGAVRVIITDARLPDAFGSGLVAALSECAPSSRCIVVSGDPDVRELSQAHAFFAKPWDRARLIAAVRQACL